MLTVTIHCFYMGYIPSSPQEDCDIVVRRQSLCSTAHDRALVKFYFYNGLLVMQA